MVYKVGMGWHMNSEIHLSLGVFSLNNENKIAMQYSESLYNYWLKKVCQIS